MPRTHRSFSPLFSLRFVPEFAATLFVRCNSARIHIVGYPHGALGNAVVKRTRRIIVVSCDPADDRTAVASRFVGDGA